MLRYAGYEVVALRGFGIGNRGVDTYEVDPYLLGMDGPLRRLCELVGSQVSKSAPNQQQHQCAYEAGKYLQFHR